VVELTLTKQEGMHWWSRVLGADPAIDVTAVEPENSKLTDLDPETRQTVEKMMVSGVLGGGEGGSCGFEGMQEARGECSVLHIIQCNSHLSMYVGGWW
jgi:hypothetical protein